MYAKTGGLDGVSLKQQINFGGSGVVLCLVVSTLHGSYPVELYHCAVVGNRYSILELFEENLIY